MTTVKNNQTQPPVDPYANNYGTGGTSGTGNTGAPQTKAYGEEGYDPGMGDEGYDAGGGYEDEFLGGEEEVGGGEGSAPPVDLSPQGLRELANEHKAALGDQYTVIWGRINATAGMSPEKAEAELAKIAGEINNLAFPPEAGMDGELGEPPPPNSEEVEKLAKDLKNKIDDAENLSEEERIELGSQVDKILNDIDLAGKDPEKLANLDVEGMKEGLTEIEGAVDEANQHSPGVKGLAEACGDDMTPEKLAAKAAEAGVSLDNLTPPPDAKLLEFLKEVIPDLKDKITAVATAISDRDTELKKQITAAQAISSGNAGGDTCADNDNKDVSNWQKIYDMKFHQDDKSKAVTDAKKAVTDLLLPVLKAIYPNEDVKSVEVTDVAGTNATEKAYNAADQIKIGGSTIDIFDNKTGALTANTKADADIAPSRDNPDEAYKIPDITYDGEGDGAWNGPAAAEGINTFGDPEVGLTVYDPGSADDY